MKTFVRRLCWTLFGIASALGALYAVLWQAYMNDPTYPGHYASQDAINAAATSFIGYAIWFELAGLGLCLWVSDWSRRRG